VTSNFKKPLCIAVSFWLVAITGGYLSASSAQDIRTANVVSDGAATAAPPARKSAPAAKSTAKVAPPTRATSSEKKKGAAPKKTAAKPKSKAADYPPGKVYYVDFRSRTAASYGHAFVWYGRADRREIEVAGLHPASESVIPYAIGHLVPVPSETGASYGDLDEEYLTASYRVFLTEAEAQRVFAFIKNLQRTSPLWHAALYNCVSFIRDIAHFMDLKTPPSHWLKPEEWIIEMIKLNEPGAAVAQNR
jgi:hypothetical protein